MIKKTLPSDFLHRLVGIAGLILIVIWFSFNLNQGERIPVNEGAGWDGTRYVSWARQSTAILKSKSLSTYSAQRVLPSILVHRMVNPFKKHINMESTAVMVKAFYLYDCLLLLIAGVVLWRIGKHFNWTLPIYFIGTGLIFLNFAILKFLPYYSALTDYTAFTFGLLIFYFYLKDRLFLLLITTFFASFVFPSMVYAALPFIIFRYQNLSLEAYSPSRFMNFMSVIFGILMTAVIYHYSGYKTFVLPVLFMFLYLFFSCRYFFDYPYLSNQIKESFFSKETYWRLISAIVLIFLIKLAISKISNPAQPNESTTAIFLGHVASGALKDPLGFLVSHIMYFGPGVLLAIFLWKKIAVLIKEAGLGLILFIGFYLLIGVGSESRMYINAWPVFAVLICNVLNRDKVSWYFVYSFLLLSLVTSRFWLNLTVGEWLNPGSMEWISENVSKFPLQMYFVNQGGIYGTTQMYHVFLAVVLILAVAVLALLRLNGSVSYVMVNKK